MKFYVQATGNFYIPDSKGSNFVLFTGYAGGDCGGFPDGVNNPAHQYERNNGPLPCSTYKIGEPMHHERLGRGVMALAPLNPEELRGRSGFFIHGIRVGQAMADRASSDGCICAEPYIKRVQAFTPNGDNTLTVIATEAGLPWNTSIPEA
jgi:hypothetical protein